MFDQEGYVGDVDEFVTWLDWLDKILRLDGHQARRVYQVHANGAGRLWQRQSIGHDDDV